MTTPPGRSGRERGPWRLPVLLHPEELEVRTWVQLVRTMTRMERRLEQALEAHGLSIAQFDILATLGFEQGITQQELAERLLVTKGNICGMIDRMEAGGSVERRPDPEDRRVNRLFLTRRGKSLLAQAAPRQQALAKEILSALEPAELQTLYALLDRLDVKAAD
jgi:MarR family transcriptional regulator, organic hydroperoxide resistance regulator